MATRRLRWCRRRLPQGCVFCRGRRSECSTGRQGDLLRSAIASVVIAIAGQAFAGPPPVERQAELLHVLRHDCGSCHGLRMTGGLGPALSPQALASKDEHALTEIVLDGVPGTPMPPWRSELSRDDAAWMIARLKTGIGP